MRQYTLFCCVLALVVTNADHLSEMEQAIKLVPKKAAQVFQISETAKTIAKSNFNTSVAADFKQKYAEVLQAEKDIAAIRLTDTIDLVDGLHEKINSLHQQTTARQGQEVTNIQDLRNQINKLTVDAAANEEHLARTNRVLVNAGRELAEAEKNLEKAKRKRRLFRKLAFIPIAGMIVIALDKAHKEVPKRREMLNSVVQNRNNIVSKEQLLVHVLEHDAVRGCPYCPRTFSLAHQLLSHVSEQHSNEQPQFCCTACGDRFQFQIQYEAHRMTHDPAMLEESTIPVSFSCSHCSKTFTSVSALQSHSTSHKEGIIRRCPVCSLSFNTLSRYENHVRKHANTSSCICQICGTGFTRRDDLDQHMKIHKGNLELGRHRH